MATDLIAEKRHAVARREQQARGSDRAATQYQKSGAISDLFGPSPAAYFVAVPGQWDDADRFQIRLDPCPRSHGLGQVVEQQRLFGGVNAARHAEAASHAAAFRITR